MEIPTLQLILEELFRLNKKLDTGLVDLNKRFDENDLRWKENDRRWEENKKDHEEIIGAITYIGNKVFDNHEVRIARLEKSA